MQKLEPRLLRVGELAKAVGKTVRAMHLYEELGLVEPAARSEGGFRLYGPEAIDRIHWIGKLQAIGFTLAEIQGFVHEFRQAGSGRQATDRARLVFSSKLQEIREQIAQLQGIENDLHEALSYLDSCQTCSSEYTPTECGVCGHNGHDRHKAPRLFAGLSRRSDERADAHRRREFDVPVTDLVKELDPSDAAISGAEPDPPSQGN